MPCNLLLCPTDLKPTLSNKPVTPYLIAAASGSRAASLVMRHAPTTPTAFPAATARASFSCATSCAHASWLHSANLATNALDATLCRSL
eukprot:CAMPEP_0202872286 /NCGR_PEP_ID=MMETSP1391-20130828/20830_1 /ASSEMBLY_ACC=CAM_ASM_000867 /TAXON_ID=1034604 /ORGANISM="Chlamydomonas leiostraca, Strain SAG 11-49" /LENGTH=88 /DNA_ID=CAMNT_0049553289 /DNA_START=9 /DNA_END=276 /DNA_ORIENTATION=+